MGIDKPQVLEDGVPVRHNSPRERWQAALTVAQMAGDRDEVRDCLDALGLLDVQRPSPR